MEPRQIALVGTGTVGSELAGFFAAEGINLVIYDEDKKAACSALKAAKRIAGFRVREHLSPKRCAARGISNIRIAETLDDAVRKSDYVQESIFENLSLKRRVLRRIEKATSAETIIASSSGTIPPSKLQTALERRGRFLIVHPSSPAYIAPIIELVVGPETSQKSVLSIATFLNTHGKRPIILRKGVVGYLSNRLYFLIWREILDLVGKGIVSATDIDLLFCNDLEWWWGTGVGPLLRTYLHGGSGEAGGIEEALNYFARVLPPIWKDSARWVSMPKSVRRKTIREVKRIKAVRTIEVDTIRKIRDRRLASMSRMIKPRTLNSFYV